MARLDTEIVGEGADLVLLHSLLTDRSSYAPLIERLASRRRLILVNLPGFGSSPPAAPIAGYAEAVAGLLDEMGLPPDVDILGNGLGGFVALHVAIAHGSRLGRIVLIGSAVAFPEAGRAAFRGLAGKVERDGIAAVAGAAMQRMFPDDFIAARPEVVADREAVFKRIDPGVFAAACRALATLDLGAALDKATNPVLIVVGEKDGATPPALARDLAGRLADARLVELPGLGHAPHLQDPDALVAAIAPFLGIGR